MAFLYEWYRYREMFFALVDRDVRLRYRGSVLGVFWTILNPALQMLVYTLVFSTIMRVDVPNYSVFVFCSLLPWTWFATSLTVGSESIIHSGALIKKIYFPSELLPLVTVTSNLINFVLALPVLVGFLLISNVPLTPAIIALPVVLAVQFLFVASLTLLFSMLNTFFRDVSYLMGILVMVWFYLTPVLYPIHLIPAKYVGWFMLNPMLHVVQAYRTIFMAGQLPSWRGLGYALVVGLVLFGLVYPLFNRQKYEFAEVL
jgi:ABC-2 type transport system permease protein